MIITSDKSIDLCFGDVLEMFWRCFGDVLEIIDA